MAKQNLATEFVLANNPDTGENATITRKAFETLYKDRGFVLVDSANVDMSPDARAARRSHDRHVGGRRQGRAASEANAADLDDNQDTGSAANMAKRLGLEGDDDDGKKGK